MKFNLNKFKNLYSLRTKTFLLAGLLGGMTACKDVMEPEMKQTNPQQPISNHYTVNNEQNPSNDGMLKYLSDVLDAEFYVSFSDGFRLNTDGNGDVDGLYLKDYTDYTNTFKILYSTDPESFAQRIGNMFPDGSALFRTDNSWKFITDTLDEYNSWIINRVPDNVYHSTFENMSDSALAAFVKERIAPKDYMYAKRMHDKIAAGNGKWIQNTREFALISKGDLMGTLEHSGFGFIEGEVPVRDEPQKHEVSPFIGGVKSKLSQEPASPMRFNGTAYVSVMPTSIASSTESAYGAVNAIDLHIFETDSAAATFAHGAMADTLIMPFNGWYKLTVIKPHTAGQMQFLVEDYASSSPESTWGIHDKTKNSFDPMSNTGANDIEWYFGGASDQNYDMAVSVSRPLYYGGTQGNIPTGLENVYCAPRRIATSDNTDEPSEVVIAGLLEEHYKFDATTNKGIQLNFVFGGVRQKQR